VCPAIRVSPETAQLDVGKTLQLEVSILPPGSLPPLTFAAYDQLFMIEETVKRQGELTAKYEAGELSASEYVTAFGELTIQILQEGLEAAKKIVSVSASGLVTGLADGHVMISVTAEGLPDICAVNMCELTVGEPEDLPEVPEPVEPERPKTVFATTIYETIDILNLIRDSLIHQLASLGWFHVCEAIM